MPDLLFVYGTLRSSFDNPHARLLRGGAELLSGATVRGSICRIEHYPAFQPGPAGTVFGELYRIADPATLLAILDEYEGPEVPRVRVTVEHRGAAKQAWTYRYSGDPPRDSLIVSGDFCA